MIEYTLDSLSCVNSLKKLWISAFDDTSSGFRTFVKHNKKNFRIYTAKNNGDTVAMLYHIPCETSGEKAHYLYGAATDEKFRNRGIMGKLIDFSLNDAVNYGEKFSFLYPADDHLYGYYKRFDYERKCFSKTKTISRDELVHIAEYPVFCVSMSVQGMSRLRNEELSGNALKFNDDYMKYSVAVTKNGGGYVVCSEKGYALVQQEEFGHCVISEMFCTSDDIYPLLGELLKKSKAEKFTFSYPPSLKIFDDEDIAEDGMVKFLSDTKLPEAYIGLRNL
ncbi:MAG: GNAT family N-acetyltransferase [Ruminococcus sp.]